MQVFLIMICRSPSTCQHANFLSYRMVERCMLIEDDCFNFTLRFELIKGKFLLNADQIQSWMAKEIITMVKLT